MLRAGWVCEQYLMALALAKGMPPSPHWSSTMRSRQGWRHGDSIKHYMRAVNSARYDHATESVDRSVLPYASGMRVRSHAEMGRWVLASDVSPTMCESAWFMDMGMYFRESPYFTDVERYEDFLLAAERLFTRPRFERIHRLLGVNTAPKDRDALYDSIVRWARRDGWTGKLFLRQIGPGKVHKAGPGTAAAAMDHNLGRPY